MIFKQTKIFVFAINFLIIPKERERKRKSYKEKEKEKKAGNPFNFHF